jgi:hypothetical protein
VTRAVVLHPLVMAAAHAAQSRLCVRRARANVLSDREREWLNRLDVTLQGILAPLTKLARGLEREDGRCAQ